MTPGPEDDVDKARQQFLLEGQLQVHRGADHQDDEYLADCRATRRCRPAPASPGRSKVNFKSDYMPLEKLANPESIAAIQMNAQPGHGQDHGGSSAAGRSAGDHASAFDRTSADRADDLMSPHGARHVRFDRPQSASTTEPAWLDDDTLRAVRPQVRHLLESSPASAGSSPRSSRRSRARWCGSHRTWPTRRVSPSRSLTPGQGRAGQATGAVRAGRTGAGARRSRSIEAKKKASEKIGTFAGSDFEAGSVRQGATNFKKLRRLR